MSNDNSLFKLGFALLLGAALTPGRAQEAAAPQTAAPQVAAQPGACRDWTQGRMAARLKLSDAQKASLKEITAKHQPALAARSKAVREARQAFHEALRNPETGAEALKPLYRTLSDLQLEQMLEARALRLEIRAVLTPEQREQSARMEGRMEGLRLGQGGRGLRGRGMKGPQDGSVAP